MAEQVSKLSLVSQFDDLCRHQSIFNDGLESEFLKFVRNQEQCFLRWLQSDRDLKNLQMEYETSIQELGEWKQHYEDIRKKLMSEQKRREEAERKLCEMLKIFGEVKEVVNRDNTLADQTKEKFAMWQRYEPMDAIQEDDLADESNLYDKTEDDLDLETETELCPQPGKRRSGVHKSGFTPPKRRKSSEEVFVATKGNTSLVATTTVHIGPERGGGITATSKIDTFQAAVPPTAPEQPLYTPQPKQKRRSRSEPEAIIVVDPPSHEGFRNILNSDPNPNGLYPTHLLPSMAQQENINMNNNMRGTPKVTPTSSIAFRHHNSGSKLNHRAHDFGLKTVIRPETCLPCGRRIKFSKQALRCHNCRTTCHQECKGNVPVPCIPANNTPTSKTGVMSLKDFAPLEPPFVPPIIYRCVNEVETRGLTEVGLYRLSAPEREVRELKEKFLKGKGVTNVNRVCIHVVCAVIKDFLRNVDTLIPRTMWKEFTDAAVMNDPHDRLTALYQGISQLPRHNRDTLAFLILHWQRVAETPEVKMPIKNLATVLGPTVVGFSSNNLDSSTMLREQVLMVKVVEKLLQVSSDYWNSLLSADECPPLFSNVLKPSDLITPDTRSAATNRPTGSNAVGYNNTTPRIGSFNGLRRQGAKSKFFASPVLR